MFILLKTCSAASLLHNAIFSCLHSSIGWPADTILHVIAGATYKSYAFTTDCNSNHDIIMLFYLHHSIGNRPVYSLLLMMHYVKKELQRLFAKPLIK
jgi:hypothetical protein